MIPRQVLALLGASFLCGFMDVYSQWILTSSESVSHAVSKNMCIVCVCSDLTEF